jgi:hypothetical protein
MKKLDSIYLTTVETGEQRKKNPKVLRVILSSNYTRIDFGYVAPWIYKKGGWIKIAPYTFIQVQGSPKHYALLEAENIPISPKRLDFESTEDWQVFTLYFEPIPIMDCVIDIIEEEEPNANDFNFYGIEIKNVTATEILKV